MIRSRPVRRERNCKKVVARTRTKIERRMDRRRIPLFTNAPPIFLAFSLKKKKLAWPPADLLLAKINQNRYVDIGRLKNFDYTIRVKFQREREIGKERRDGCSSMAYRTNRSALIRWYFCFQPSFRERVPF